MPERRVVVIGASAGGMRPLLRLVSELPSSFGAPVLVVLHIPASGVSRLPRILDQAGLLPAVPAAHREWLEPARILVAPPDRHLVVTRSLAVLSAAPAVNGARPSVDVLFGSAAAHFGSGAVAVILSGALRDGARGMAAVVSSGGVGIVQDPDEATQAGMPRAAVAAAGPQHVLPADQIASMLCSSVDARSRTPVG